MRSHVADCWRRGGALALGGIASVVIACAGVRTADACSVPVFRYALERWAADLYEVDVFYRGALTPAERALVSRLEDQSQVNGGGVNWEVVHCRTDADLAPDLAAVWESLGDVSLPHVVLRRPGGRRGSPQVWRGPLSAATAALGTSPQRDELVRRLLGGDAVVWLVVRGTDDAEFAAVQELLADRLPALADETPLPPGVGLPGSELYTKIPLEVRFSSLVVDGRTETELAFRRLVAAGSSAAPPESATLVVPVFGRGRAMPALRAGEVDAEVLADIARFLCGACSCQVKQANPGFDLLLDVNWDERLFGDEPVPAIAATEAPSARDGEPSYVAIPSGSATASEPTRPESPAGRPETPSRLDHPGRRNGWLVATALGLVFVVVCVACVARRSGPPATPREGGSP